MSKTILLFGGSGMVGRELTHALVAHTVVAPPHARVDITDVAAVERVIKDEKPNFIINAAALINVNAIEKDHERATRVNVQGATAIARAAAARAVPQLLISSSYVFGDSPHSYTEDAVRNPTNAYGKTKAEAEEAIEACTSSAPWYIVRSSWFYSPYRNTFVDEVAQTLLQDKPFESSAQRGNPTHCGEFAAAIVKYFIDSSLPSGIYHIVNEGNASRYDIVREVAHILGVSESLAVAKDFPSNAMRPSVLLKNTKLPLLTAWEESFRAYILTKYATRTH